VLTVEFTLAGESYIGLNGGSHFKFTEAVSFTKDRFGLSCRSSPGS
jgi:predicted 3-demethylubiquinone-9 3-methyltransferase (glyoxalase superfamily)